LSAYGFSFWFFLSVSFRNIHSLYIVSSTTGNTAGNTAGKKEAKTDANTAANTRGTSTT